MKTMLKSAFALAALAGASTFIPNSALAGVNVSVGIGVPGPIYASPYGPDYSPYEGSYYYDPIYIGGFWYHGPYRWQMRGGERMFFVNGRWHRNEWRGGAVPNIIMFHNGGSFRDGHNIGFGNAERINARFHPNNNGVREDRRELNGDRKEMQEDRRDLRDDKRDKRDDKHDEHTRN